MGRKTWDSIPENKRPLKDRLNVVLTSKPEEMRAKLSGEESANVLVISNLEQGLVELSADSSVQEIFVIGGSSLYEACMGPQSHLREFCKLVIATRINKSFECDVHVSQLESAESKEAFPPLHVSQTFSQGDISFDYVFFGNANLLSERPELIPTRLIEQYPKHQELQYLEIIDDVIKTGKYKDDRTGTGIFTKFGYQMRFDLQ